MCNNIVCRFRRVISILCLLFLVNNFLQRSSTITNNVTKLATYIPLLLSLIIYPPLPFYCPLYPLPQNLLLSSSITNYYFYFCPFCTRHNCSSLGLDCFPNVFSLFLCNLLKFFLQGHTFNLATSLKGF